MSDWIVVVDDEPLSLTNARKLLTKHEMRVSCLRSGTDLLTFMEKNDPDLILLDILMPEMDGFETYKKLRQLEETAGKQQTPVIFLTGEKNQEIERRGLKAGASDFIHKPFDQDILIKRIRNTIANSKTIQSLTEEAKLDKLTGFFNKVSGTENIAALCKDHAGALMLFDLDNFKLVNDLYGHDMGDRVLVAFSDIMKHNVRNEDIIARIGGDEFIAFFLDMTGETGVSALVQRVNEQFMKAADQLMGKDHGIPLGVSVGCAFAPSHAEDYQLLFQFADSALYQVKRNGKHGYEIYRSYAGAEDGEENLERDLSRVLQIVSERDGGRGTLLLGQEAFSWNYQFIIRFLKRYGGVVNRILFSVSSKEKGVVFTEIVAQFGKTLINTLRRSDLIFQCRQGQFFVVLPQLTEKDTPGVIERIMKAWSLTGYQDRVRLTYLTSFASFKDEAGGVSGAATKTKEQEKPRQSGDKKRVLIVDDDPAYATMVREWIKDRYRTDIVTSGKQAMTFLQRNQADLILLDYQMPDVDGPQLLDQLRQDPERKDIPVVFLTGITDQDVEERIKALHPSGCLLKTMPRKKLLDSLTEMF